MSNAQNWEPGSWRKLTALQQPTWDKEKMQNVFEELSQVPPLP